MTDRFNCIKTPCSNLPAPQENKREKKLKRRGNKTLNESSVDAAEEELGLQGATADDAEAEHIRQVF